MTLRRYPLEEFAWGLGAGSLALVVAALLAGAGTAWLRGPDDGERRHTPVAGVPMTAAALGALSRTWPVTASTLLGLAGVALVLAWFTRRPSDGAGSLAASTIFMAPFAYLLAADASSTGWVRGLVVAGVVVGAAAACRTDVEWGRTGVTPALYALTAAGVFACVPDTEQAATLLGASVPAAVAGWPLGRTRLGPTGAGSGAALLVWVSAVGGRGREPSIVGAVACLGLLLALPAGRWIAARTGHRRAGDRPPQLMVAAIVVVHAAVVAVASRVAGVSADLALASAVATAALAVALAASVLVAAAPR